MADFALILRVCLAVVFLTAAVGKTRSASARSAFASSVAAFARLRSARMTGLTAGAVVAGEFLAALTLPFPATSPIGLLCAGLLLTCFTAALALAVRSGSAGPCHCFGAADQPPNGLHLARNAVLIAITAAAGAANVLGGRGNGSGFAEDCLCGAAGLLLALGLRALESAIDFMMSDVPRRAS
jgi:hypothetical protein